ncbi:MAG: hypothetical protein P8020_02315 [Acidobacteriota bacterium]
MNSATLSSEELVRRYVFAVSRRLPANLREDVAKELDSLLRETIEEQSRGDIGAIDPQTTAGILKSMGSPDVVAARYSPKPNYLIGPELYPAFMRTLRLVLMASGAFAALVVVMLSFSGSITGLWGGALKFGEVLIDCIYSFAAVAVLVFALLERLGADKIPELSASEWDPFRLPPVETEAPISSFGVSLRIYAIAVLLIWFNFFPQWFGMILGVSGRGLRFLSAAELGLVLPVVLINCWWVAALVKNILLLRKGRMTAGIRWFEVGLGLGAVLIFGLILRDLWTVVDTPAFRQTVGNPDLAGLLGHVLRAVNVGIILTILGQALLKVYRLRQNGGTQGHHSSLQNG